MANSDETQGPSRRARRKRAQKRLTAAFRQDRRAPQPLDEQSEKDRDLRRRIGSVQHYGDDT